ncbi:hypothetical protein LPU83_pLPU83b_0298 (plasmid) [Rhizobium favelukesii]|uniref:Ku domain-containing protein n=1 Tax=Rhizobium favelukesii TaxID=348824 RepID=W6S1E8_9HYPH|nr:hypothetical protein LPU83_pLPU83b_0298 [Rhizobium favelukesii]
MAIRPYWKGYLKLSLVTCPVQMMPATSESEKVRFHTLNRETQNRVVSHYVDSVTGKEVKDEDEVKGYQRGENEYIMLEDEELENVALESTKTIDISTFTPRDSVEWILARHTLLSVAQRSGRTGSLLRHPRRDGGPGHGRYLAAGDLAPGTRRHAGATRKGYCPLDLALRG